METDAAAASASLLNSPKFKKSASHAKAIFHPVREKEGSEDRGPHDALEFDIARLNQYQIPQTSSMSSIAFGIKNDDNHSTDEFLSCDLSQSTVTLQDSFLKFREMKKKERHILKLSRQGELNDNGERTDLFKSSLREKFIDAAKRYIGVPYAKRFKAEDEPEAPLYLDCCALVRRAVMDLQDDFGIILGKWNQAYQMDTLPIVLSPSELKPGDLIFYEGHYISKRSKVQKHNNVHVEIFLGGETGEATIGSRYQNGKVSMFPSYKFTSSKWTLVQYHFRSLDTWLSGECRSHCPEHPWHSEILSIEAAAGRKSIFNDGSEDELAECYTDDSECDRLDDNLDQCVTETTAGQIVSDLTSETDCLSLAKRRMSSSSASRRTSRGDRSLRSTSPTTRPFGVLDDAEALQQRRKSASHDAMADVCIMRSQTICVGKRGGAAREGLGLLPGQLVLAQKGRKSLSDADRAGIQRTECRASHGKMKTSAPHTYYVGKSNGWRLVKDSLDRRGWQQLPFDYSFSSRFSLKWVERRSQIDYKAHTPGQLVNHIPNNDCISTKIGLLKTLREKYCRVKAVSAARKPTPWLPETYELDSPADVAAVFEVENRLIKEKAENHDSGSSGYLGVSCDLQGVRHRDLSVQGGASSSPRSPEDTGCIWIYKPSCSNRGRGIKVVRGVEALALLCYGKPGADASSSIPPSPGILQRYVENPLLVGKEALKFDVRCYMLIASTEPYRAYYHPGYCRLSLKTYSTSAESLEDPTVHLTNASVQKKDPLYALNKERQIRSIGDVADDVERSGDLEGSEYLRNQMDDDIKQCMVDVLKAAMPKMIRRRGFFDLFGFDFMVSTCPERTGRLLLLEVNTNPALSLDNAVLADLLPGVVDGALDLVLTVQGPDLNRCPTDSTSSKSLPGAYTMLYDELLGYEFESSTRRVESVV